MLIGKNISSPSKSIILVAPPDMIFLIMKGLDHLGFIFPLKLEISSLSTFRTKSSSLRFLVFTFLLNTLADLFCYPCAWYYALALFSSIKANYSYHAFTQSSSKNLVSTSTLKDCISTSMGRTASLPIPKSKVLPNWCTDRSSITPTIYTHLIPITFITLFLFPSMSVDFLVSLSCFYCFDDVGLAFLG